MLVNLPSFKSFARAWTHKDEMAMRRFLKFIGLLLIPLTLEAQSPSLVPMAPDAKAIALTYGIDRPVISGAIDWKVPESFCPSDLETKPTGAWRSSLIEVDSSVSAVYRFARTEGDKLGTLEDFSLWIETSPTVITLKHSNPKLSADVSGIQIPWPDKTLREFYLEGQEGSSLWVLIPPLKNCRTQSILICPRTFVPRHNLSATSYTPKSARFAVYGKVDALLALGANETGKAVGEISVTDNITKMPPLPQEDLGSSPHVKFEFSSKEPDERLEAPTTDQGSSALAAAIEAKLSFTKSDGAEATLSHRSDFTVTAVTLGEGIKARFRLDPLNVQNGGCFAFTYSKVRTFSERKLPS